jgi:RNA polymerase sigma-70 factor (ECF subfamily)
LDAKVATVSGLEGDFDTLTRPYRRELLAHCYRLLGSTHDAEDLLQETLLRAWRAADRYDADRASVRTWLYRIATNACLTALETRRRRPLPAGLVGPSEDPDAPLIVDAAVPWLEPFPDRIAGDPAAETLRRESLRLAFVAALQTLSAQQRAVLILREVLQWPAADVADCLDVSVAAVNSSLQRARTAMRATGTAEESLRQSDDPQARGVVDRYVDAFVRADVAALTAMLRADVVLEMPPVPNWYVGVEHYGRFMERVYAMRGEVWRALPVSANGQPGFAAYARGADGDFHAHSLQVFTVQAGMIVHNVVFADVTLFPLFGLPSSLRDEFGAVRR